MKKIVKKAGVALLWIVLVLAAGLFAACTAGGTGDSSTSSSTSSSISSEDSSSSSSDAPDTPDTPEEPDENANRDADGPFVS